MPQAKPEQVKHGACELRLGAEVFLSGEGRKQRLEDGEIVIVDPGRTAVLLTEEEVRLPDNTVGLISLRSHAKLPGLVNVSGFHVDPGFRGKLIFTVHNAGTARQTFARGDGLFLLWLADMDKVDDPYDGSHQGQTSIPSALVNRLTERGVAPAVLQQKLEELEQRLASRIGKVEEELSVKKAIIWAIIIGLAILILEGFPFRQIGSELGEFILRGSQSTQRE